MPYAPGISFDSSPIANGLMQGASAIAQGILANAKKRKEKEDWEKTVTALQPMLDQQTGGSIQLKKDTPKQAIPAIVQFAQQQDEARRNKPLQDLRMESERLRQENEVLQQQLARHTLGQQQTDLQAGRMAANPQLAGFTQQVAQGAKFADLDPNKVPDSMLAAYLAFGGQNVGHMNAFERLDAQRLKSNKPGLSFTDYNGRTIMTDANGNARELKDPVANPKVTNLNVGGKPMTLAGSHLLDDKGNLVTAPKPMDPIVAQGLYTQLQSKMDEITNSPKPGFWESKEEHAQRLARLKQDTNMLAGQLGQQLPYPKAGILPEKPEAPADAPAAPTPPAASSYSPEEIAAEIKRRRGIK